MSNELLNTEKNFEIDVNSVKSVEQVAGKNLPYISLKDNAELDGMNICIIGATIKESRDKSYKSDWYAEILCMIYPDGVKPTRDEHGRVLATGAGNVFQRVEVLLSKPENPFPVVGKLRRAGDAWILD